MTRQQTSTTTRTRLAAFVRRLVADDRGAEVSELAIVLSLIVAASVGVIILIGPKVAQFYVTTNSELP